MSSVKIGNFKRPLEPQQSSNKEHATKKAKISFVPTEVKQTTEILQESRSKTLLSIVNNLTNLRDLESNIDSLHKQEIVNLNKDNNELKNENAELKKTIEEQKMTISQLNDRLKIIEETDILNFLTSTTNKNH